MPQYDIIYARIITSLIFLSVLMYITGYFIRSIESRFRHLLYLIFFVLAWALPMYIVQSHIASIIIWPIWISICITFFLFVYYLSLRCYNSLFGKLALISINNWKTLAIILLLFIFSSSFLYGSIYVALGMLFASILIGHLAQRATRHKNIVLNEVVCLAFVSLFQLLLLALLVIWIDAGLKNNYAVYYLVENLLVIPIDR